MRLNMYERFHQTALQQPESAALLGPRPGAAMSYAALDASIQAVSETLRSIGVVPGACVGLHYPSSAEYIIYTYAIWRCGACVVPVSVELTSHEKREVCECIAIDYLLTTKRGSSCFAPLGTAVPTELPSDVTMFAISGRSQHPPGFEQINSAFIRFTSGTTGTSKGVVLSHETINERIRAANDVLHLGPEDRVLWVLSMSYHFTVSIVAYLTFGATIVLPENHFAAAIADSILRTNSTVLYASPIHYALLADFEQATLLPSLRLAISTTSSIDRRTAVLFAERSGRPIAQALGIIEVGLPCIHADATADRWNSVGRVLPAYEMRLEDVGLGSQMQEIVLRGPGLLDAYYRPFRTRSEIIRDGWFHTGDVGFQDEGGYLVLKGRSKDVINVMGMKFFPQEVEGVLASHPGVEAVSVFGGPENRRGERVLAWVVTKNGCHRPELEHQLLQFCKARLASYKVPEHIEFVQALPKTASGKILRRAS